MGTRWRSTTASLRGTSVLTRRKSCLRRRSSRRRTSTQRIPFPFHRRGRFGWIGKLEKLKGRRLEVFGANLYFIVSLRTLQDRTGCESGSVRSEPKMHLHCLHGPTLLVRVLQHSEAE